MPAIKIYYTPHKNQEPVIVPGVLGFNHQVGLLLINKRPVMVDVYFLVFTDLDGVVLDSKDILQRRDIMVYGIDNGLIYESSDWNRDFVNSYLEMIANGREAPIGVERIINTEIVDLLKNI